MKLPPIHIKHRQGLGQPSHPATSIQLNPMHKKAASSLSRPDSQDSQSSAKSAQHSAPMDSLPREMTFDRRNSLQGKGSRIDALEGQPKITLGFGNHELTDRKSLHHANTFLSSKVSTMGRLHHQNSEYQKHLNVEVHNQGLELGAGVVYKGSPQPSGAKKLSYGRNFEADENSAADGELNIMNNKQDHEKGSHGAMTNCTGFFIGHQL